MTLLLFSPSVVAIASPWLVAAGGSQSHSSSGLRLLLALAVVVALALMASSRKWWALRRNRMGAMLTTGGWLAVLVGYVVGPRGGQLVTMNHVQVLTPLIYFGLGWVGLMVGLQAHRQLPQMLPRGTGRLAGIDAVLSLLVTAVLVCGFVSVAQSQWQVQQTSWTALLIESVLLGCCVIGWAPETRSLLPNRGLIDDHQLARVTMSQRRVATTLRTVAGLGTLIAVLVYGLLFKTLPMADGHDQVAIARIGFSMTMLLRMAMGVGMSLLIAVTMGLIGRWLMQLVGRSESEFLVVLIGLVSFAAGAAAYLRFSPLFVLLLFGAVIVNLPGRVMMKFNRVIMEAEQPMAMALMLVAGILMDLQIGYVGEGLALVLILGRFAVKFGVIRPLLGRSEPMVRGTGLLMGPMRQSPLAITLALGFAVAHHGQVVIAGLKGEQILAVLVIVGFLCDTVPLAWRLDHRLAESADSYASSSDTETRA